MYIPFDKMPDSSRVWIYQSNREFRSDEIQPIREQIENFLNNWQRHGSPLNASYRIVYDHFIILLVDEDVTDVSGCAIDASVNLIKMLEKTHAIDLTDKLNVTFKDHENINVVSLSQFKRFAREGRITGATPVFNNLITTKGELALHWEVPAAQSWHKRFIG